jgi:hypothetical protein
MSCYKTTVVMELTPPGRGLFSPQMNLLIVAIAVIVLLVLCWPLALGVLLLLPLLWLISLPFRLLALIVRALFAFLEAILFLPARLLGWRSHG